MSLVLVSQSPRRRELLGSLGLTFKSTSVDIDETPHSDESPIDYVRRLGLEKARAGQTQFAELGEWFLGSDTTVVCDNQILGKPTDFNDFERMMNLLSDTSHQVYSSIAVIGNAQQEVDVVTTQVEFDSLTPDAIQAYWASGEPQDKAGGYGIQGLGSVFVREIRGSYSNVVGLPLRETAKILGKVGMPVWQGRLILS